MSPHDFHATLTQSQPPGLSEPLRALWWDFKGDWAAAHSCVDDADGAVAAWVHAYLHRREGDMGNAGYWYRRAGKPVANGPLDQEREAILAALLAD